ncbi:exonuclease SbcC [Pseudonocardia kujensis]|uniref:putative immunity protein n=1 Tax=Pseudonocardia kujensis TaxID=1128675 RepID=UPI001E5EF132|nr:exonuclease SbcC [Pseudonocardia kujensis]MCE0762236.1 exonuclease SbcC [Pseudonocardia kujensis]
MVRSGPGPGERVSGDFVLTMEELREVARYAVESAVEVLPLFERDRPEDRRPRSAVEAAWVFVDGAARTRLQRVAAVDAHRAAREAGAESARHAARAAGDAASAAYLHPLAEATQVGHILRSVACAARALELAAEDDPGVGERHLAQACERASPRLVAVLKRYPPVVTGPSRVARLMASLDGALRSA